MLCQDSNRRGCNNCKDNIKEDNNRISSNKVDTKIMYSTSSHTSRKVVASNVSKNILKKETR